MGQRQRSQPGAQSSAGAGLEGNREQQLVEKLRRVEALLARAGSEGERQAAARAREGIQARHLFVALLRRYGIQPYRYRGQRRITVMARLSRPFVNERPPGGSLGRAAGEGVGEKPDLGEKLDP